MTDSEIYKKAMEIYERATKYKRDRQDCQFRGKEGEKFCKRTSHDSCIKCRFYSPGIHAKLRALVEYIIKLENR